MNTAIPSNPGLGPDAGDKCERAAPCQHPVLPLPLFETGGALPLAQSIPIRTPYDSHFPSVPSVDGTESSTSPGITIHLGWG